VRPYQVIPLIRASVLIFPMLADWSLYILCITAEAHCFASTRVSTSPAQYASPSLRLPFGQGRDPIAGVFHSEGTLPLFCGHQRAWVFARFDLDESAGAKCRAWAQDAHTQYYLACMDRQFACMV